MEEYNYHGVSWDTTATDFSAGRSSGRRNSTGRGQSASPGEGMDGAAMIASAMLSSHRFSSPESSPEPEPDWSSVARPTSPVEVSSSEAAAAASPTTDQGPTQEERDAEEDAAVRQHYGKAKPLFVSVSDARREGRKGSYVSYLVSSTSARTSFDLAENAVRRRYSDFIWLYRTLVDHYTQCVIPPLPEKHRMRYLSGGRFAADFLEQRRRSLERFLTRIARHPVLQRYEATQLFLTEEALGPHKARFARVSTEASESMMESLSDSLIHAFSKAGKPDSKFVAIAEGCDRLEENLREVERLSGRLAGVGKEMEKDYDVFGKGIQELGVQEAGMAGPLRIFGDTTRGFGDTQGVKRLKEEEVYMAQVHELILLSQSLRAVMRIREQKQIDHEELSVLLRQQREERERLGRGSGAGVGIVGKLKDKLEEVKGQDMERLRRGRLERVEGRVRELEMAVEESGEISRLFSREVLQESDLFSAGKRQDLGGALGVYAGAQVEFYRKGAEVWEEMVGRLERQEEEEEGGEDGGV